MNCTKQVDAKYRNRPVWIKILGKLEGLTVQIIDL